MRLDPGKRMAGVLVPVFSLRGAGDMGIGDTAAVREAIEWCARHNVRVLQLLPINETGADNSPYNAISAVAIDPATLALLPAEVPDLTEEDIEAEAPRDRLALLRQGPVAYAAVRAVKDGLLWRAYDRFRTRELARDTGRAGDFRAFCAANAAWLENYATFRVLIDENGGRAVWTDWPEEQRSPEGAAAWMRGLEPGRRAEIERRRERFAYIQWLAYAQWEGVRACADRAGVQLMGDIPFGVSRYSADVWAERDNFDLDWSGGAPPEKTFAADEFTEKWGQNWGIPLYRWDVLRERNFGWWRLRVGSTCRVFHIFRIDHVLGFFRIYAFPWVPERNGEFLPLSEREAAARTGGRLPGFLPRPDDSAEHREANRGQGESLLRMVLEAAGSGIVVAEDLGVVPEYVPPALDGLGVPGFAIPMFRRHPHRGYHHPDSFPRLSVATPGTHDHPPLAAAWADWSQCVARQPDSDAGRHARREIEALMEFAGLGGQAPPRDFSAALHEGVLRATMASPAWLAVAMLTDVFGLAGRFNVPGISGAGNWTFRMPVTVAEWERMALFDEKGRMFARLAAETGRAG